jgi:CheY-like chemotaxis protein
MLELIGKSEKPKKEGEQDMKYKVLLAGSSKKVINDFFFQLDFYFECLSSSMIFDDLKKHVGYFKPDIFIFCMSNESRDDIVSVANFHHELAKNNVPYAVIGDSASIEFVSKIPGGNPELTLRSTLTAVDVSDQIITYIKKYKTKGAFSELSATPPIVSTDSIIKDSASSDTYDMMEKIDAEIAAMEKVGVPNQPVFNPAARQPELPDRHRILVIDDATIVHKAIKGYLDSEYEVATAISGKIALRFLQSKEVSLILLDYEMPEMDGPTVLTKLRENPYFATIPVVFLTGINDVEKIKNALALKPQGYLLKPVDKTALITKMHELIN